MEKTNICFWCCFEMNVKFSLTFKLQCICFYTSVFPSLQELIATKGASVKIKDALAAGEVRYLHMKHMAVPGQ